MENKNDIAALRAPSVMDDEILDNDLQNEEDCKPPTLNFGEELQLVRRTSMTPVNSPRKSLEQTEHR